MPHFIARNIEIPEGGFKAGEFVFGEIMENISQKGERLLHVKHGTREFFIRIKERDNDVLVRFDKSTRISPIGIIKSALRALSVECKADVISSNLAEEDSLRQKSISPFLKTPSEFLEWIKNGTTSADSCTESNRACGYKFWVEIGFGSGRHLLFQAKNNPDKHFLALEIHTPSIEQVLRRLELENLNNVTVISYDARVFLELMESNSIERLFVHFPVPWEDKPRRRVFSREFLSEAMRTLAVGGILELRSDSLDYFTYAKELALELESVRFCVRKNMSAEVLSKYEERWQRQNKNIYDLLIYSDEESRTRILDYDFSFAPLRLGEMLQHREVKDGYFGALERFYRSSDGSKVAVRCSFGDFAYPEKKYIFIEESSARYFGSPPIPTIANYRAHKLLESWLS
ncbi:MAG: tRNA (guanosine(46)-N7)-methyltransferase TrmB [Wolinella sp.]